MKKIMVACEVDNEFLSACMMVSDIGYWDELGDCKMDEDNEMIELTVQPEDEKAITITHDDIAKAIGKLMSGETSVNNTILGYITSSVKENDASMIDADCGDCIVQIAAFGEIVYG